MNDVELLIAEIKENRRQMRVLAKATDRRITKLEKTLAGVSDKRVTKLEEKVLRQEWKLAGVLGALALVFKRSF